MNTPPDMNTGVAGFLCWFALVALFALFVWVVNRREEVRARRAAREQGSHPEPIHAWWSDAS